MEGVTSDNDGLVSLRQFAKEVGTSVESVRRGIASERLTTASVHLVNGRPRIDLARGRAEWEKNMSEHQLRSEVYRRARQAPVPLAFPPGGWHVSAFSALGGAPGVTIALAEELPNPDTGYVFELSIEGARELGARLMALATEGERAS